MITIWRWDKAIGDWVFVRKGGGGSRAIPMPRSTPGESLEVDVEYCVIVDWREYYL